MCMNMFICIGNNIKIIYKNKFNLFTYLFPFSWYLCGLLNFKVIFKKKYIKKLKFK